MLGVATSAGEAVKLFRFLLPPYSLVGTCSIHLCLNSVDKLHRKVWEAAIHGYEAAGKSHQLMKDIPLSSARFKCTAHSYLDRRFVGIAVWLFKMLLQNNECYCSPLEAVLPSLAINLNHFPEISSIVFTSTNALHFRFNLDKWRSGWSICVVNRSYPAKLPDSARIALSCEIRTGETAGK